MSNNNLFHPYQRPSVKRSQTGPSDTARSNIGAGSATPASSLFGRSTASTAGLFRPVASARSVSSVRPTYTQPSTQSDDIFGEFNSFISRRELLRSANGKNHLLQSTATQESSPFARSTTSNGTVSSLDLYTDPELLKARKEIRDLKEARRALIDEKALLERKVVDLESNNEEKESKVREVMQRVDQLETDCKFLLDKNKELTDRLENAEEEVIESKAAADLSNNSLRRQVADLREELSMVKNEAERRIRGEQQEKEGLKMTCNTLSKQLADCKGELQKQIDSVKAAREQMATLERRCAEADVTIRRMETHGNAHEEMTILRRQLNEQITHIKTLEAQKQELSQQNRYLRGIQENTERLKDEKENLERQLERLSQVRRRIDELEFEVSQLRNEKARWTKFLEDNDDIGVDSPYTLSKSLAQQRLELAVVKEKLGQEEAKRAGRESYISRLERELHEWMQKAKDVDEQRQMESRASKRLERARALAQKEADFLKEQLKSYDMEEENMMSGNYDQQKAQRIAGLEQTIEEYREYICSLEEELRSKRDESTATGQTMHVTEIYSPDVARKIKELEDLAAQLKQDKVMLEKECESLDGQVHELQRALGRGEYNPATTRVLQLADNPERQEAAIRQATLDALREENRKLMEQISKVGVGAGHGKGPAIGMVPIESLKSLEIECLKLQQAVEDKEKRVLRLKEVYQAKAQEYREAVASLLGYNLEIEIDGRSRLTSIYAEQQDPSFLFTSNPGDEGTVQLVGGSGGAEQRVRAGLNYYVTEKGSVPAFLAGVTLELFERVAEDTDTNVLSVLC